MGQMLKKRDRPLKLRTVPKLKGEKYEKKSNRRKLENEHAS